MAWARTKRVGTVARVAEACDALTEQIDLEGAEEQYWRYRWCTEVIRVQERVVANRKRFYYLRGISVVSGVIVPALVGLNLNGQAGTSARWAALVLSSIAAVSLAVSGLLRYGERWRLYRRYFSLLYAEGFRFANAVR